MSNVDKQSPKSLELDGKIVVTILNIIGIISGIVAFFSILVLVISFFKQSSDFSMSTVMAIAIAAASSLFIYASMSAWAIIIKNVVQIRKYTEMKLP